MSFGYIHRIERRCCSARVSTYTQDSLWIYRPPFLSNVVGGGGEEEGARISCVFVDVIVVVSDAKPVPVLLLRYKLNVTELLALKVKDSLFHSV